MSKNILFVVEGERTEPRFLKRLVTATRTFKDYEIFSYSANVYKMLEGMFVDDDIDTDLDFLEYLRSCRSGENTDGVLDNEFSDIFLFFDMDPQDPKYDPDRLSKAARYFDDSTENGKLYINYPMMESFRHISNPYDLSYLGVKVAKRDIKRYKEISASEGCHELLDNSRISEELMIRVVALNLIKANSIITGVKEMPALERYEKDITQVCILAEECKAYSEEAELYVLNTSVFNSIDYNRERFYNRIKELGWPVE